MFGAWDRTLVNERLPWQDCDSGACRSRLTYERDRMSNVIKFERPPEPKAPKPKKTLSPSLRKGLVWAGVVIAFAATWAYFSVFGG